MCIALITSKQIFYITCITFSSGCEAKLRLFLGPPFASNVSLPLLDCKLLIDFSILRMAVDIVASVSPKPDNTCGMDSYPVVISFFPNETSSSKLRPNSSDKDMIIIIKDIINICRYSPLFCLKNRWPENILKIGKLF